MKIAVDVCVGDRGTAILRDAGHEVIEAAHCESDRDWCARALAAGVEMFVSADADIEIYAYDVDVRFFQARQRDSGIVTAQRVLAQISGRTLR